MKEGFISQLKIKAIHLMWLSVPDISTKCVDYQSLEISEAGEII